MWFLYALSGAFFKSLAGYYRKLLTEIPSGIFVWLNSLFYIAILLPFVVAQKLPFLDFIIQHWLLALGLAFSASGGLILNVKALSKDDLSFVAPLNGFIPVVGLLGAWFFVGELPSILGIFCVFLIFAGTYIMALHPTKLRWYDPLVHLITNRAVQLSFGVAILYALNTILTKSALNLGYNPLTVLFATDIVSIVFLSYIFLTKQRADIVPAVRKNWKVILASSVASLLGSVLHAFAVSATYVSYALAVRRFDSVFSVLMGWKLLKETNIRNKLIGAGLITLGSILLALLT